MLTERSFAPSLAEVSVYLMTGQQHTGYLARFTPNVADITLALSKEGKDKTRVAAEQVAFVGFLRAPTEPPAATSAPAR